MRLNYQEIKIDDVSINVARSRCRTMHITIGSDKIVYAVCPKYASDREFYEFLTSKLAWIKKSLTQISEVKDNIPERMTKKELEEKILMFVKKYSELLGVSIKRVTLRKMTTRWGSCTKMNRTIRFSTMLTKCNDLYIEYIVVHELSHLIEANHGKRFWSIVKTYIPDYKIREKNKYNIEKM